jgi:methyl-accepting chemotaxis protein
MKGRLSSTIWRWTGINAAALFGVLLLAYGAGARSGGLGIQDFGALPKGAGFQLLGALFLIVAATVALVIQLSSKVLKPVDQLTQFSERTAARDYSARAEVSSGDEFELIAENVNRMVAVAERADASEGQQQALDHSLAELTELIGDVGRGNLTSRAQVMADASAALAESINRMLESLARIVHRVHDSGAEVTQSARQGLSSAESFASSVQRQQQEISQFNLGLEKFAETLRDTGFGAEAASTASRRAVEISERNGQALRDAAEGAGRIRSAMSVTAEHIKSLGERSLQVYDVINIINDTHLLAVNAAIEASRAAQSGNGLEVLDGELKKLGEHSRKSTKSVVELLQSIHSEANEAAAVVEQANRLAQTGATGMEHAVDAFNISAGAIQEASLRAETTTEACRERLQEAMSMAVALQNSARSAKQGADSAQKAVSAMEQLVRSTIQLHENLSRLRTAPALNAEGLAAEITAAASAGNIGLP